MAKDSKRARIFAIFMALAVLAAYAHVSLCYDEDCPFCVAIKALETALVLVCVLTTIKLDLHASNIAWDQRAIINSRGTLLSLKTLMRD